MESDAINKYDKLNMKDAGLQLAFGIEGYKDNELKDDPNYVKMIVR